MKSTLLPAPRELEPIEHGRVVAIRIAGAAVRPEALAGDDVLQAVAVHVDEVDGVQLGELHAVLVLLRSLFMMMCSRNLISLAFAILLVPRQAEAVRGERGDHVVEAVAVHVVGVHLRAAAAHRLLVKRPDRIARERGGLFPPAVLLEQVLPAVAVHVAHAHAVREVAVFVVRRNRMERPRLRRVVPVRLGVAVLPLGDADQLRLPVAGEVGERRRFVVGQVEDLVPRPVAVPCPSGFSNHDVSSPGKPMIRMSFQPSLLKSRAQAKKLSEYLFSTPSAPSKPGTVHRRHRAELQLERRSWPDNTRAAS